MKVYTELEAIARVQSVKSSNAIEGINTTDSRIKEIVNGNSAPLNHNEAEIAGYRDALDEIHNHHSALSVSEDTILYIHQTMLNIADYEYDGQYKLEDNLIMEVGADGNGRV